MTDHAKPVEISTAWMPERAKVAFHAKRFIDTLVGIAEADDETGERDALLVAYGSAEAGVKFVLETQGRVAAIALVEIYAAALREPLPDNPDPPMQTLVRH